MTAIDFALKQAVARDFGMAATGYDRLARLQRLVGGCLADRLPADRGVRRVVDLGCGTGFFLPLLRQRYPLAELLAVDLSEGMVRFARENRSLDAHWLVGDAEALSIASGTVDILYSSLVLQWCPSLARALSEIRRVLAPGGTCVFSTLLEGTLWELDRVWQRVDPGQAHVNRFLSQIEFESFVGRVFDDAELEVRTQVLEYGDPLDLLRELKGLGARHKGASRRRSLTGARRLRAFKDAYEDFRLASGAWPATYRLGYARLERPRQTMATLEVEG